MRSGRAPGRVKDTRAADTQKCIRAGGKHNDLEDVGFDTYHHTIFEMLGNWSFGDYFKKESVTWGWELITRVWGIPAKRLFATVYSPDKSRGDPSEFDQEAFDIWTGLFRDAGLDPAVHIVHGGRKDNFWMMGDTGPCGPCSEIHFNLLPGDDEAEGRTLVNSLESALHRDLEPRVHPVQRERRRHVLAARGQARGHRHGFRAGGGHSRDDARIHRLHARAVELQRGRVRPAVREDRRSSRCKTYNGTVPKKREGLGEQENIDVAFRVLADHARCVACAIADGILPGNEGRNYVIRRILRRGILYGKKLALPVGFFEQLVTPVVESLGPVFPELAQQQDTIRRVIRGEEESFGRTIERGLSEFNLALQLLEGERAEDSKTAASRPIPGDVAFRLYDTYGFPLDMTQLLAAERGLTVDTTEFERLMQQQRDRARAAQKKEIVVAATEGDAPAELAPTKFLGYTMTDTRVAGPAKLVEVVNSDRGRFLVFDQTPFYAEMGGQAGDTGTALIDGHLLHIADTVKDKAGRHLHQLAAEAGAPVVPLHPGASAELSVDLVRRRAISRHHSAAHLIHWALRKTLGTHVRQAGTSKTPDRMRFDFSHFEALTPAQLREVEQLVNEKVIDNAPVETYETEYDRRPEGTLAFFGDKYGRIVRVVDIGGYSRELCGGTHVRTTGEIGVVKIVFESAIAAGTRRIEAVAGQAALDFIAQREAALAAVSAHLSAGPMDVAHKLETLLAHQKELEKRLKSFEQKAAAGLADELAAGAAVRDGLKFVSAVVSAESPEALRSLGAQVVAKIGEGVVTLGTVFGAKASIVTFCSPAAREAGFQAGRIVGELSAKLGGKGGGKPDFAMGGGKEPDKLAAVLQG